MERKYNRLDDVIDVLNSIDKKLSLLCGSSETETKEDKSEEEIKNFLKGLTEELGIKDRVTIRKVEIR